MLSKLESRIADACRESGPHSPQDIIAALAACAAMTLLSEIYPADQIDRRSVDQIAKAMIAAAIKECEE